MSMIPVWGARERDESWRRMTPWRLGWLELTMVGGALMAACFVGVVVGL